MERRKPTGFSAALMGVILLLLLTACGSKSDTPPLQPEEAAVPQIEETDWQVTGEDAGALDLSGGLENPDFEYIFNHTDTVPLDQLAAFSLVADALSEGAVEELYQRFLEAPNKVLAYLESVDGQITELPGWEPAPTSELICKFIATNDAAMYGGTEEFAKTLSACRETYPDGRISELLDVMESEHTAALERLS